MSLIEAVPGRPCRRTARVAAVLLSLLVGLGPALADHDDDDDDGGPRHRMRSYEYDDRGCRYKYREDEDGYKIEYRCRGRSFGAERYRYEVDYDGCEYKYEQDARGYKEELDCDDHQPWWIAGRGLAPRHSLPAPVARGGPFGIGEGRCNSELIGEAVGDAISRGMGDGSGRDIAGIAGAVIGQIVGAELGRTIDQDCVGQTLEFGRDDRPVEWIDPDSGARVQLTPTHDFTDRNGRYCREFRTLIEGLAGRPASETFDRACRRPDGAWVPFG